MIADLSKYQGAVDFAKLKSQVEFVILRVQAGYTTHDSKYKEYVAGCKANGIPFGTYAYFRGVSVPDAIAEAKCAMELTDPESKFFALDIEANSMKDLASGGQAFIDYLKNKGMQKVGLYSGEYFYKQHNLGAIKTDFVWLANYGKNDGHPHNQPVCDLWQYTSVGKLDGIQGNVDLNQLTGSKPLEYFTGNVPASVDPKPLGVVTVVADHLNLRQDPDTNSPVIRQLNKGEQYVYWTVQNGWYNLGKSWAYGDNGNYLREGAISVTSQPVYYTIKSGDNLTNIANNNGTTVKQLQAWNNIGNPNRIYAGQKIRIK